MNLIWSAKARQRRDEIFDYIAAENPMAALWLDEQFAQAAHRIQDFPQSGRIGRVAGTRETVVHENYILVYEIRVDKMYAFAIR